MDLALAACGSCRFASASQESVRRGGRLGTGTGVGAGLRVTQTKPKAPTLESRRREGSPAPAPKLLNNQQGMSGITQLKIVSKGDWESVMEGEVPLWLQAMLMMILQKKLSVFTGQQLHVDE
uniref:Uncharacterized protein n=1 Tax=Sphaerodactylus townsendi TaxID=933632 RepID=A0ACB8G4L0_9SAUR